MKFQIKWELFHLVAAICFASFYFLLLCSVSLSKNNNNLDVYTDVSSYVMVNSILEDILKFYTTTCINLVTGMFSLDCHHLHQIPSKHCQQQITGIPSAGDAGSTSKNVPVSEFKVLQNFKKSSNVDVLRSSRSEVRNSNFMRTIC